MMPLGVFVIRFSANAVSLESSFLHDSALSEDVLVSFFSNYDLRVGKVERVEVDHEEVLFGVVGKGESLLLLGVILESELEEAFFKRYVLDEAAFLLEQSGGNLFLLLAESYSNMLTRVSHDVERHLSEAENRELSIGDQQKKIESVLESKYDEELKVAEELEVLKEGEDPESLFRRLESLFGEEKELEEKLKNIVEEKERAHEEASSLQATLNKLGEVLSQLQTVLLQARAAMVEAKQEEKVEEEFYTVFDVLKSKYGEENAVILEYLYIIRTPQSLDEIVNHLNMDPNTLREKLKELVARGYVCTLRKKKAEDLFYTVCPSCPLNTKCMKERKMNWAEILSMVKVEG
ncbi:MAG: hypothetical protein ACTSUS_07340 [Candidatus Freyarchaeota archaeon]